MARMATATRSRLDRQRKRTPRSSSTDTPSPTTARSMSAGPIPSRTSWLGVAARSALAAAAVGGPPARPDPPVPVDEAPHADRGARLLGGEQVAREVRADLARLERDDAAVERTAGDRHAHHAQHSPAERHADVELPRAGRGMGPGPGHEAPGVGVR